MHIWTNSHFGLVKSVEISKRIKPDHHPIFPSQKIQWQPPSFSIETAKIDSECLKNCFLGFEF
jgi:hypothetical protein